MKRKLGFSVVEVTLAVALFAIFGVGVVVAVISNLSLNQSGQEQTIASQYASEGVEAIRSIKNQNFSALTNGNWGIVQSGGVWTLSGANNTWDKYTRVINISSVQRDVSGNIVASGGTVDPDTKKVTVTVSWNVNPVRPVSSVTSSYVTNWKAGVDDGVIVYGDTGNATIQRYRLFNDSTNSFTTEGPAGSGFSDASVGRRFVTASSPTKKEAVAGYESSSGAMRIMCFDGSTWSNEFTVALGGNPLIDGRFDIGYEKSTGDVIVVYSKNVANTNELAYRTKSGSVGCGAANWSGENLYDAVRTTGTVHWIRVESNPVSSSSDVAVAWADSNSDLSVAIWTGNSFGIAEPATVLENNLERASGSQDVLSFDLAYESLTGNLMVVWGLLQATTCTAGTTIATTNCIRYARYSGAWEAVAVIPTVADPATNIDIAGNPASNELALIAVDNSQADTSLAYWSGSTWTGTANRDTSAQAVSAGAKRVAIGWLKSGSTSRSIAVYDDAGATTNIGWVVGNGAVFTSQTDVAPTPAFGAPQTWYEIYPDPINTDKLMFVVSDNNNDLFAKRLVMTSAPAFTWTNSDGGAALETLMGQAVGAPYGFSYWKQ